MIWHLPSPAKAQKYRVDVLYEGEQPATEARPGAMLGSLSAMLIAAEQRCMP